MDHAARTVVLDSGQSIAYDYLTIAAGVTANYFGIPGAKQHAMPLYRRSQALAVRDAMFAKLEAAHRGSWRTCCRWGSWRRPHLRLNEGICGTSDADATSRLHSGAVLVDVG